jgi:predicted O-methyltransferase YrrM
MEFPNWFDVQRYNFEFQLQHLKGKPNLRFLQIGAYTGDASVWLCQNVLTDFTSILIDVDTWSGSNESEHSNINFDEVYEHYESRVKVYKKVIRLKMTSDQYLAGDNEVQFDFIYIDGDHTAAQVARDAEGAWGLLKSGGILAFDDYLWGPDLKPEDTPKPAIDKFLKEHEGEYVQLVDSYQVWIRKL